MVKKFKLFKESILSNLKSLTYDEVLNNLGSDEMIYKMISQNNIGGINYAIEHGADENKYLEYKPMLDLIGEKVFCVRKWSNKILNIDCSIFTNENVSGYGFGCGLYGDYFTLNDFNKAFITKTGDSVNRYLYTIDELPIMCKKFGLTKNEIIEQIKRHRSAIRPDVYVDEKKSKYFVEINDIFK